MAKEGPHFPPRDRLKLLRKRKNLSQEELGELIGAHRSQIQKMESGKGDLKESRIRQLAKALGCEPWELFDEAPLMDADVWELVQILERLSPDRLATLRKLGFQLLENEPAKAP